MTTPQKSTYCKTLRKYLVPNSLLDEVFEKVIAPDKDLLGRTKKLAEFCVDIERGGTTPQKFCDDKIPKIHQNIATLAKQATNEVDKYMWARFFLEAIMEKYSACASHYQRIVSGGQIYASGIYFFHRHHSVALDEVISEFTKNRNAKTMVLNCDVIIPFRYTKMTSRGFSDRVFDGEPWRRENTFAFSLLAHDFKTFTKLMNKEIEGYRHQLPEIEKRWGVQNARLCQKTIELIVLQNPSGILIAKQPVYKKDDIDANSSCPPKKLVVSLQSQDGRYIDTFFNKVKNMVWSANSSVKIKDFT